MIKQAGILVGLVGLMASTAFGQGNVGPGELRFNQSIFKASHNSYWGGSLAYQIDALNMWCVELDIYNDPGNVPVVQHHCGDGVTVRTLAYWLADLAQTQIKHERPTLIYLEMKDASVCHIDWPSRAIYRGIIRDLVNANLGAAFVYTAAEFKGQDQSRWPSWQELSRRGYQWVVVLDEAIFSSKQDDDYFFGAEHPGGSPAYPPGNAPANSVMLVIDGGCDVDTTDQTLPPLGDRWMARGYPGGACAFDCGQQDGNYWENLVNLQYTFIATDCRPNAHTYEPPMHSPAPLYVRLSGSDSQYGTLYYPYLNVEAALNRASPMVPVKFRDTGVYDVTDNLILDRPVVLKAEPGVEATLR